MWDPASGESGTAKKPSSATGAGVFLMAQVGFRGLTHPTKDLSAEDETAFSNDIPSVVPLGKACQNDPLRQT